MKPSRCRGQCRWLAPLLLLALPACQRPEEPPRPADLLPKERLIPLLADVQVLEARVEASRLAPDSSRALYQVGLKELFWKHEVTDSVFQRSYRYYGVHGKDLDDIYGAVIDTLGARERRLTPAGAAPPAVVPPH